MDLSPAEAQRAVQELLRLPGNTTCADCHAPSPTWASINIGVFICLECSAHHRAMGTHISKVKSTTLDKWTGQMVEGMRRAGNAKANTYWERGLPKGLPRPNTAEARGVFIRQKYEQRKFIQDAPAETAANTSMPIQSMLPDTHTPNLSGNAGAKIEPIRRRRAPPTMGVQSIDVTTPPVLKTLQRKDDFMHESDLLSLSEFQNPIPQNSTEHSHQVQIPVNNTSSSMAKVNEASSFAFISQPGINSNSTSLGSRNTPDLAALSQISAELNIIAGTLERAKASLTQFEQRRTHIASLRSNLSGLTSLMLNNAALDNLLTDPTRMLDTAQNLKHAASIFELLSRQPVIGPTGKLKDDLATECAKLDDIQMNRIDGLVLGSNPPSEVLERRRAASSHAASLVKEAHSLYQQAACLVEVSHEQRPQQNSRLPLPQSSSFQSSLIQTFPGSNASLMLNSHAPTQPTETVLTNQPDVFSFPSFLD